MVLKNPDLLKQQGQNFLLQDTLTRAVSILSEFETREHFGKNKKKNFCLDYFSRIAKYGGYIFVHVLHDVCHKGKPSFYLFYTFLQSKICWVT